jgi:hypothetical protein
MKNRRETVIRTLAVAVALAILLGFTGIQVTPLGVEIAPQWESAVAAASAMPGVTGVYYGPTWLALGTDEHVCIYTNTFGPDGRWVCRDLFDSRLIDVHGGPTFVAFLLGELGGASTYSGDVCIYNLITDSWENHFE